MNEFYWNAIYLIFFMILMFTRIIYAKRYKKIEKNRSVKKKREEFLVLIVSIGMMIIPLIGVFTNFFINFRINLGDNIRWMGVFLFGISAILFWWVHKTLGDNWSPMLEIQKNHTLIKSGPYKLVRHPMYTQVWLWVICQWLILSNWFIGIAGFISWGLLYFIRVNDEEKMMIDEFGDEYRNYMKNTKKIIPWIY